MTFSKKKIIFNKIMAFSTQTFFQVMFQYGVASLCNQLLSEFSGNPFETLHRCYKLIEDVHVTFCRRKTNFNKITTFLT